MSAGAPRGERAWWLVVTLLGSTGVGLAVLVHGVRMVAPVALVTAAVVLMAHLLVAAGPGQVVEPGAGSLRKVCRAARIGVLSGGGLVAMIGHVTVLGVLAWPMFLLLAVSSPHVLRHLARARRPDASGAFCSASLSDDRSPALARARTRSLRTLSTQQLGLAWRLSFWDLERATSCRAQIVVVQLRQAYLDELERRDPDAVRCWLASGADAATDPTRYFGRGDPPTSCAS